MVALSSAWRRTVVALVILALAASMIVIGAGKSDAARYRTRVSLKVTDRTVRPRQKVIFFGKVRSRKPRCRRNRVVLLKRRGTGTIRRDRTDREGEFRFRINPRPNRGRYFVKVKRKVLRPGYGYGYGGRDVCRRARSRTIKIRPRRR